LQTQHIEPMLPYFFNFLNIDQMKKFAINDLIDWSCSKIIIIIVIIKPVFFSKYIKMVVIVIVLFYLDPLYLYSFVSFYDIIYNFLK